MPRIGQTYLLRRVGGACPASDGELPAARAWKRRRLRYIQSAHATTSHPHDETRTPTHLPGLLAAPACRGYHWRASAVTLSDGRHSPTVWALRASSAPGQPALGADIALQALAPGRSPRCSSSGFLGPRARQWPQCRASTGAVVQPSSAQLFRLERAPGGGGTWFRIATKARAGCAKRYLGAASSCRAPAVGWYALPLPATSATAASAGATERHGGGASPARPLLEWELLP